MIEQVTKDTYRYACAWWESRNWPIIPYEMIPDTCYYSKIGDRYIAFVSLYLPKQNGGGKTGWMEAMVADPESSYEERTLAINELLDHVEQVAKDYGLLSLLTMSNNSNYLKRIQERKYHITEPNCAFLVRALYE